MTAGKRPRQITGRMVLIGFILFFGVIAAVNGVLAYFALNTWPGLTTEDAYKKGLAYNQTIAKAEQQAALGWTSKVAISEQEQIIVHIASVDDASVGGLDIRVTLERPVGDPMTQEVILTQTASGSYTGAFATPESGRWKAEVRVLDDKSLVRYRMVHELMVEE